MIWSRIWFRVFLMEFMQPRDWPGWNRGPYHSAEFNRSTDRVDAHKKHAVEVSPCATQCEPGLCQRIVSD